MPFRSPQGEGRFESASARRLRCPFSFACCTRFVKWIPYVEVWQWRRFERDCPDSGATMAVFLLLANLRGGRIPDSAERVVDKFLVARAAFTLPKESGNVLGGEVERRTAMQAVQPCL